MAIMERGMTVPEETAVELCRFRDEIEDGRPDPGVRFLADMYAAGWSCGSIGRAMGWPRNRAHYWATRVPAGSEVPRDMPVVPPVPEKPGPPPAVHLEPATATRLRELYEDASQLRGAHGPDHPYRKASEELTEIINTETARGVTYREIGTVLGIGPGSVRARLARHGYRTTYPGLTPYRGRTGGQS